MIAGCISGGSQALLRISGQILRVKTPTSSSTLLRASLSECARALFLVVLIVWFLARLFQPQNRSDHCQTIFGLSMELRSRAIPEPWPLPPVHSSFEMEASLLDSGVQELLEPEDVGACGLTSDALLQWATLTEFRCVVGLFELNCWAVPLTAVGRGGGPSGAAHPLGSCGVNFVKIAADLESQLEIVSEIPGEFMDERHTFHRGSALGHRLAQSHQ